MDQPVLSARRVYRKWRRFDKLAVIRRATGAADDDFAGEIDVAGGALWGGDAAEHGFDGDGAHVGAGLAEGGEGDAEEFGVADVVDSDDADFLRDVDAERVEGVHEFGGSTVVAADEAVGGFGSKPAADEGFVLAVADDDFAGREAVVTMGVGEAVGAGVDGGRGVRVAPEDELAGADAEQVLGHAEAGAAVVDADDIVRATIGVGLGAMVEDHDRDVGLIEHLEDGAVGGVLFGIALMRGEEYPGDASRNILLTELAGLGFDVDAFAGEVAPEQGMAAGTAGGGHALTDGLKDFSFTEAWDEKAEELPGRGGARGGEGAGAGSAFEKAFNFKLFEGALDGKAGDVELCAEVILTG